MSPELDWTIEYETLPPDDSPLLDPAPPPRRPGPPRWIWLAGGLLVLVVTIVYVLWFMGGRIDPRPEPDPDIDPARAGLEAVVDLEIKALNTQDRAVYDLLQDSQTHRRNPQPSPDGWFAGPDGPAGEVELIDLQLIEPDSAYAEVKLTWDETPYRLIWFYRRQDERWLHTDWQPVDLGQTGQLATPHVTISFHEQEEEQAGVLINQIESFLGEFCALLPCPAEPLTITLEFDPFFAGYSAERVTSPDDPEMAEPAPGDPASAPPLELHYRLPSPLRVRWPCDNQPEPLVLGSLGRHIANDLFANADLHQIGPTSQAALELSSFWLAHHLLDLEQPPGVRWLDEANASDGLVASRSFILALTEGVADSSRTATDDDPSLTPPDSPGSSFSNCPGVLCAHQLALVASFQPATAESAVRSQDYFGWLIKLVDPKNLFTPTYRRTSFTEDQPYLYPQQSRSIQEALDTEAAPWAPRGGVYRRAIPDVTDITRGGGWTVVTAGLNPGWEAVYSMQLVGDDWALRELDDAIAGGFLFDEEGPYSLTDGPITITYWLWDEPFIDEISTLIGAVYEATSINFQIEPSPAIFAVVPITRPDGTSFQTEPEAFLIFSPAWAIDDIDTEVDYRAYIVLNVIWQRLASQLTERDNPQGWALLMELLIWQGTEVVAQFGIEGMPPDYLPIDDWLPPSTVSAAEWKRLDTAWATVEELYSQADVDSWVYSRLVVRYILELYGPETLPLMLNAFNTADSMGDWVTAVTGQALDQFELAWREWVVAQYGGG